MPEERISAMISFSNGSIYNKPLPGPDHCTRPCHTFPACKKYHDAAARSKYDDLRFRTIFATMPIIGITAQ